jgi:hypothetical protein
VRSRAVPSPLVRVELANAGLVPRAAAEANEEDEEEGSSSSSSSKRNGSGSRSGHRHSGSFEAATETAAVPLAPPGHPEERYPLDPMLHVPAEAYCAAHTAALFRAVAQLDARFSSTPSRRRGQVLYVPFEALPLRVPSALAPHFGLNLTDDARTTVRGNFSKLLYSLFSRPLCLPGV